MKLSLQHLADFSGASERLERFELLILMEGRAFMQLNHGLISVDDHIQNRRTFGPTGYQRAAGTIASRTSSAPPTAPSVG